MVLGLCRNLYWHLQYRHITIFIKKRQTDYQQIISVLICRYQNIGKGPEWNPLLFAHPSTLNNRKPIGCADPTLGVCDGGTPYQKVLGLGYHCANSNGFHSGPLLHIGRYSPVTICLNVRKQISAYEQWPIFAYQRIGKNPMSAHLQTAQSMTRLAVTICSLSHEFSHCQNGMKYEPRPTFMPKIKFLGQTVLPVLRCY